MPYCVICGKQVALEDNYCGNCGMPLTPLDMPPIQESPQSSTPKSRPSIDRETHKRPKERSDTRTVSSPFYYLPPQTNWSKLGNVILLILGIIALAGLFLSWVGMSGSSLFGISISVSGWDLLRLAGIEKAPVVFLTFIGTGLVVVLALIGSISTYITGVSFNFVRTIIFATTIFNLLTLSGIGWFFATATTEDFIQGVDYGPYLSGGAAIIGLIFGGFMCGVVTNKQYQSQTR